MGKKMTQPMLLRNFVIHHHYKRKYNQPGMTSPAKIYSMPPALGINPLIK